MKKVKDIRKRQRTGYSLAIIITAAVFLEAISAIQYFYSRSEIAGQARELAQIRLQNANLILDEAMNAVEAAVDNVTGFVTDNLTHPEKMHKITTGVVNTNNNISECGVLFRPDFFKGKPGAFSPATFRKPDGELICVDHGSDDFDYYQRQWYRDVVNSGNPLWTDPYFSNTDGRLICTYSRPFRDRDGKIAGVIFADISMDWLQSIVEEGASNYDNSFSVILNARGIAVIDTRGGDIPDGFFDVRDRMVSLESGEQEIEYSDTLSYAFFAPLGSHGWSMAIVCPENEIFGAFNRLTFVLAVLMLTGLLILALIVWRAIINLNKLHKVEDANKRMENELSIAHSIQMGIVPKTFPPFPERNDIDIYASMTPAWDVGGDFYDFYLDGDRLWFCIADVSGKGVPAALVMAITVSHFRTDARLYDSPEEVVTALNDGMAGSNAQNMFVTMFVGMLDLMDGRFLYCNAGHNAPVVASAEGKAFLPVDANLPIGLIEGFGYRYSDSYLNEGGMLFLYTDGLTEAENPDKELFGEEKMLEILDWTSSPEENIRKMTEAVAEHAGEARQSDDLTMLAIRFNGNLHKSLTIENRKEELAAIPEFVDSLELAPEVSNKVCLALDEIVTNVVLYAYEKPGTGKIKIDALLSPDKLVLRVTDSGKAFDPTDTADPDISLPGEERPIGGLGIFLVRKLMDEVRYRRQKGKNVLRIIKNLK
ncbi:MAG: SpoIIE family protein phosphatase [Bacteroidales bacterium]|nr:SpoIIE family protein phosphatase [Bacteroidales bacterium]